MTGFAHAADDDAATRAPDHGNSADERLPETAPDRGAERSETAGFGVERAQCAGDQSLVRLARQLLFAARLRLGHGEPGAVRLRDRSCSSRLAWTAVAGDSYIKLCIGRLWTN